MLGRLVRAGALWVLKKLLSLLDESAHAVDAAYAKFERDQQDRDER